MAKNAAEIDSRRAAATQADEEESYTAPPASIENSDALPALPNPQALVEEFESKIQAVDASKPSKFIDRRKAPREKPVAADSLVLSSADRADASENVSSADKDGIKRIGEMMIAAGVIDGHRWMTL